MQIYLQPLQNERLLPTDDLERLLISSFAIVKFQKSFLEELLEVVGDEKNDQQTLAYSSPNHLRVTNEKTTDDWNKNLTNFFSKLSIFRTL